MTIILQCDMCEEEKINLRDNKVFDIRALEEITGWTNVKNQIHICVLCSDKQKKWDSLQNGILDDFESKRIMTKPAIFSEVGTKKPKIDVLDGSDKVKIRTVKCRYCDWEKDYAPKASDQLRYHEMKKHADKFEALGQGKRRPKTYRFSTRDD